MALRFSVVVAAALGASVDRDVRNLTHGADHGAAPTAQIPINGTAHAPANGTKLATHAAANGTKLAVAQANVAVSAKALKGAAGDRVPFGRASSQQALMWKADQAPQSLPAVRAVHQQRSSISDNVVRRTASSPVAALKDAPPVLTKPAPASSAVHAYPMIRSATNRSTIVTKKALTYSVKRDGPRAVINHAAKEQCECQFEGICETQPAMTFMSCLQQSCGDSNCQCEEHQYLNACHQLSDACKGTALQLTCFEDRTDAVMMRAAEEEEKAKAHKAEQKVGEKSAKKAATEHAREKKVSIKTHETKTVSLTSTFAPRAEVEVATIATTTAEPVAALYAALEKQKEELCGLSLSHGNGILNAAAHKDLLKQEIDANIVELEQRCKEIPEMHCEKDFHEYSAPPEECGVAVDNEFTRHAFRRGGAEAVAKKKSGCSAAMPGAIVLAALAAAMQ